jgi:hypothetical protein
VIVAEGFFSGKIDIQSANSFFTLVPDLKVIVAEGFFSGKIDIQSADSFLALDAELLSLLQESRKSREDTKIICFMSI